jgi:hypothetical protein
MKKRFGVLRVLATVLKVLGIVAAALSVLGGLISMVMSFAGGDLWAAFGFDANSGFFAGLLSAFMVIVVGVLYAVMMYGYGELIMLFLSMEENTYNTAKMLEEVIKDEKPA